jgi:hypothetical protein
VEETKKAEIAIPPDALYSSSNKNKNRLSGDFELGFVSNNNNRVSTIALRSIYTRDAIQKCNNGKKPIGKMKRGENAQMQKNAKVPKIAIKIQSTAIAKHAKNAKMQNVFLEI